MSLQYGDVKFGYPLQNALLSHVVAYTDSKVGSTDAVARLMSISSDFYHFLYDNIVAL